MSMDLAFAHTPTLVLTRHQPLPTAPILAPALALTPAPRTAPHRTLAPAPRCTPTHHWLVALPQQLGWPVPKHPVSFTLLPTPCLLHHISPHPSTPHP